MHFPPDFLWGTATAAHQVEGNNTNNDWWQWEQAGHIVSGHNSGLACNWWADAEADLDRAAEMGTNAHRLSVEWSRIEPEPSVFDEEALTRYREILQGMRQRGIRPMVTLHHFTNPIWLAEKGDFSSELAVDYFNRYTGKVVAALGDLVTEWVTINEPLIYVFMRHVLGVFPAPEGQRGWSAAMRTTRHLLRAHAVAYHAIKERHPETPVGVAKNFLHVEAADSSSPLDRWLAGWVDRLFNGLWMEAMASGRLRWPLGRGRIDHLAGSFDYVGVNYYTRLPVSFTLRPLSAVGLGGAEGALGDEIVQPYPEGLLPLLKKLQRFNRPIYITENGTPDAEDNRRPALLMEHLRQVWLAINFNFRVMGYYHWTLTDNFEWDRGWTQRFGLIAMDPDTQERTWRDSGRLYQEICRRGVLDDQMAERYAPALLKTMFPGQGPDSA